MYVDPMCKFFVCGTVVPPAWPSSSKTFPLLSERLYGFVIVTLS